MECVFQPLISYPVEPTKVRKRSPFKSSWRPQIEKELRLIKARSVVIQARFSQWDIRADGWPRSTSRPGGPDVVLSFETEHGPLSFPCDTYTDWEANLTAIAKTLEALRAIDRYGATRRAEQYRGWAALPPAGDDGAAALPFLHSNGAVAWCLEKCASFPGSPESWLDVMLVGGPIGDTMRTNLFRECAKVCHPDSGGSDELFTTFSAAKRMIEKAVG